MRSEKRNTHHMVPYGAAPSRPIRPQLRLWPIVNRKLVGRSFSSKDALWAALEVEFSSIPAQSVKHLYASMARRMAAVMAANGANTKY